MGGIVFGTVHRARHLTQKMVKVIAMWFNRCSHGECDDGLCLAESNLRD